MKSVTMHVLAAACLSALAAPAMADAYSTVSFGNVTITLTDLNSGDGIAPSITFLPNANQYEGNHIYGEAESWAPRDTYLTMDHTSKVIGKSLSDTIDTGTAASSASIVGSSSGAGFSSMSLSASAASGVDAHGRYFGYATVPFTVDNTSFILSANTMVSFSAKAAINTDFTVGYTAGALEGEMAYGRLTLYAGGSNAGDATDMEEQVQSVYYLDGGPSGAQSAQWNGTMTASYSNLGSTSATGQFYAEAEVGGRSVVLAAVPEPSSYAMLLGGLAVMGALARRRKAS
ncbi:PEP-CTERM sorting domain-containing protein [Rugamonas sp.]|uniref:PEP-CTERM sorting domain-containing protein n=1 Tax=Rugamonas sp. TaxID=1926287 RepID=UPI0025F67087|nr:PEP-CTERM sorting domain-containing protein [Rugamonas sp.]